MQLSIIVKVFVTNDVYTFKILNICMYVCISINYFLIIYIFPSIHVKYRGLDPRKCGDVIAQSASVHLSVTGTDMHLYSYICVSVYLYLNLCIFICVFVFVYLYWCIYAQSAPSVRLSVTDKHELQPPSPFPE